MAALTCNFHILASRVTAGLSAVFFSGRYVAETRYVRALLAVLIRHIGSILFRIASLIHEYFDS
jgi:hypothetical protein